MVSIVIPVYNAEKYLHQCLDSILNQDYKNIEIILIDDGSTDNSRKIIEEYSKIHSNIIYRYQINSGAAVARNLGMSIAGGKYIMFVDADDMVTKSLVSELIFCAERNNSDIVACSCIVFDDKREYDEHFYDGSFTSRECGKKALFEQLIDLNSHHPGDVTTAIGVPWGKLYRRDFLVAHNLVFNKNLRRAQDNIFNMYAFEYADNITYIDKCLYKYRRDHISAFKNTPEQLYSVIEARNAFFCLFPAVYDDELKILFENEVLFYLFVSLLRICSKKVELSTIKEMIEKPIYRSMAESVNKKSKWYLFSRLIVCEKIRVLKLMFSSVNVLRNIREKWRNSLCY